jgi:hypothetical protein
MSCNGRTPQIYTLQPENFAAAPMAYRPADAAMGVILVSFSEIVPR